MANDTDILDQQASVLNIPEGERFRLLVEAVTDYAIFMLDPAGLVASWNAGAERANGYRREEILGRHFSELSTEEDRQAGLPHLALAIAEREGRFETEGWRVRKDGARLWAHVVIEPIRSAEGRLIGYAKVTRDLTDRLHANDELRRSEERFRLLVDGVIDYAIYMLDPDGRVSNWNAGARRIKGYSSEEIVGEHFGRFYTPEDREAGEPQRALAVARLEGRYEKEAVRVRKDGSRFWASVVIDAIWDKSGGLVGYAKITRDITERVAAQKELEVAREAFHQAQKMESLGQLTGGIAHDFNNLLMAVLSSLEMLRRRMPDDPRLTQLLDNAVQGAERGAALTQRMLAFARRQDLKSAPLDAPELIAGLHDLLARTLGPAITISVRVNGKLPLAQADANQLELAIINLAVNARDAMPSGGAITIELREEVVRDAGEGLSAGRYVCVALTDTGEGMDEETLARATEPFFTTKGVGRGTGLGLSMVHGFAEQLAGGLRLSSRKGEGTTAELWLPVAEGVSGGSRLAAGREESSPTQAQVLTILAVDDDALVLMNTAAMLEELGHKVFEASNGLEALAVLRAQSDVDLVIADYAMPRMTGGDLAIAIGQERPGLPVILATGYAELPAGFQINAHRLPKPFGQNDLVLAIAKARTA